MRKSLLLLLIAVTGLLQAQNYIPLINNISPVPQFNGYTVALGETQEHFTFAPVLVKPAGGKILFGVMGASTQAQIATALEAQGFTLKDVKILNFCVGGEDVNDWLIVTGSGWKNVSSKLLANGYTFNDVQGIIYGSDDLKDQSVLFPSCAQSLATKTTSLIKLCKTKFPNLKIVSLQSRLCEYKISDSKFGTPSGYFTGFANKIVVESSFSTGHKIDGVWVTDKDWYIWTNGEEVRSDGFSFKFAWMKQRQTSVHLNTALQGDDIIAAYGFNNMKRYPYFK